MLEKASKVMDEMDNDDLASLLEDPAVASGPLITTLNDVLSLIIYFGIATIFITRLM